MRPAEMIRSARARFGHDRSAPEHSGPDAERKLVVELYRGLLGRDPDEGGLAAYAAQLRSGVPVAELIRNLVGSEEFSLRQGYLRVAESALPNLRELHPERYRDFDQDGSIFLGRDDGDVDWLERAILEHNFYDSFGVWSPTIDVDKRVTAALVEGLGAKSCLELGAFTGPVLSLLDERGIEVTGVDISHLAFVMAYPSIKNKLRYGDLLDLELPGPYEAIIAMDVLEHVNPARLPRYIERIASLLDRDGYCVVNSPMFGNDDVFGEVLDVYLPEWREAGPDRYWREMHCDAQGWPDHGHLVWASPHWWERQFEAFGLVRAREIERATHRSLAGFFATVAPARRSFFVLRHADSARPTAPVVEQLSGLLDAVVAAG